MNYCPYCEKPVEDYWSYCHHCNKPLIANLYNNPNRSINQTLNDEPFFYDDSMSFHSIVHTEEELFDINDIRDEEIELKIHNINKIIEQKNYYGEPLGPLLLEKSSFYYQKRDLSTALKILENALNSFIEEKDLLNVAISHNEIGIIHEELGFFDEAIYNFDQAIDILKQVNDAPKLINVYNNLANVYYLLNDLEHSYEYYNNALQMAERENLSSTAIKTSSNLVEVLFLLKDYNEIKRILMRNLEYFKHHTDIYGTIITLIKTGKLFYFLGPNNYEQSYQNLKDALDLITKLGDQASVFVKAQLKWECFLYLGKLNLWNDDSNMAEVFLLESLEAIRTFEIGESIKEGLVLKTLAKYYEIRGEYKGAVDYYNLSYEVFFKYGDDSKCAELKYNVAQIYLDFINLESEAIKYFEEALEIYEDLNYLKESADILQQLGDIYVNNGIIDLALSNLQKARDYYQELQDENNFNTIIEKINKLTNSNISDY